MSHLVVVLHRHGNNSDENSNNDDSIKEFSVDENVKLFLERDPDLMLEDETVGKANHKQLTLL